MSTAFVKVDDNGEEFVTLILPRKASRALMDLSARVACYGIPKTEPGHLIGEIYEALKEAGVKDPMLLANHDDEDDEECAGIGYLPDQGEKL